MHASPSARAPWGLATLAVCALLVCGGETAAQTTLRNLQVGTRTRSYYLHVPPSYSGETAMPLVLVLHGWAGNGRAIENASGFSTRADRDGFLVAYPNAQGFPSAWGYGWGSSDFDPAEELAFFALLLDTLESEYVIDPDRIYVAGISDGANMTHLLGAVFADRLAGVATVAGAVGSYRFGDLLEAPPPVAPIPVLIIHGLLDRIVPYDGGPWGTIFIPMASVAQTTAFWVAANGCNPKPTTEVSDDERVVTDTFFDGKGGSVVRLCTVVDGGHEWFRRPTFNATDVIWDFFQSAAREPTRRSER
jgi:polyhydroxybutyrate depolymerase